MLSRLGSYLAARGATEQAAQGVWYSEPEIYLAEALRARGFEFAQQVRVSRGETSVVFDFLIQEQFAVEVDGKAFHDWLERDFDVRVEHNIWTLRVPAWMVVRDAERVVSRIALELLKLSLPFDHGVRAA